MGQGDSGQYRADLPVASRRGPKVIRQWPMTVVLVPNFRQTPRSLVAEVVRLRKVPEKPEFSRIRLRGNLELLNDRMTDGESGNQRSSPVNHFGAVLPRGTRCLGYKG